MNVALLINSYRWLNMNSVRGIDSRDIVRRREWIRLYQSRMNLEWCVKVCGCKNVSGIKVLYNNNNKLWHSSLSKINFVVLILFGENPHFIKANNI